jgi:hypothetical protein
MSDTGDATRTLTLEALAHEVALLKDEAQRSQVEITALKGEIAQLHEDPPHDRPGQTGRSDQSAPTSVDPSADGTDLTDGTALTDHTVSRRGALRALGGVAAGGVGLALGSALLGAEPAAASNPSWVLNQANTGYAELTDATVSPLVTLTQSGVDNPNPGPVLYAIGVAPSDAKEFTGSEVAGNGVLISDTNQDIPAIVGVTSQSVEGVLGVSGGIPDLNAPIGGVTGSSTLEGLCGVTGVASGGDGVYGVSVGNSGVHTGLLAGVAGDSNTGVGVIGTTGKNGVGGVLGVAGKQSGIGAVANTGVLGDTDLAGIPGVTGTSSAGDGVMGLTLGAASSGVVGIDHSTEAGSSGVSGQSTNGYGVVAQGTLAPIRLVPAGGGPGAPETDQHAIGEIYMDPSGQMFQCVVAGNPGTWRRLTAAAPGYDNLDTGAIGQGGSINLLRAPIRVLDTRFADSPAAPTRAVGPLNAGTSVTLQMTGVSVGGISVPSGAIGVIGNLTSVNSGSLGYLRLYPAGVAVPASSSLNYDKTAIANFCIVAVNGEGQMVVQANESATDVVFDVTGFVY